MFLGIKNKKQCVKMLSRTKVMTKNTNFKQLTSIDRHAKVCCIDSRVSPVGQKSGDITRN